MTVTQKYTRIHQIQPVENFVDFCPSSFPAPPVEKVGTYSNNKHMPFFGQCVGCLLEQGGARHPQWKHNENIVDPEPFKA